MHMVLLEWVVWIINIPLEIGKGSVFTEPFFYGIIYADVDELLICTFTLMAPKTINN